MATFIHSKLSVIKVDDNGGTLRDISEFTNSVTLPSELEEVETTCFGATSRTYIPGFAGSTISLAGNWDRTFDGYFSGVYTSFRAGTLATVSLEYSPEGTSAGDVKYTGELVMTSYEVSSAIDDPVTWSAEFRLSGALTIGTH